ncbi:helix-turn-helix transcriptional regulator [Streptomyces sp. NBC_00053]|uniref:helix-turn-helix domain-containing protein n=1 Tax=unclassified Streptomyces TaxID=2593676 RepID=UPI000F5B9C35|nr:MULTISPECIES: helix-turn-helix transcriptional regulator [unclassified Streptomyces]WSG52541.1 helix-turn-helix transcriptional regulator [Streptomyces sp. NBC_01732]WSX03179.1 helix-turn-helix transcriptional regulator [Streptomyces sp. NBC_00987]MCX5102482.1 helix-turn-helix transcriptional regulator [Streptomyces sp. NBC_00439]MCX5502295.1 helix-turn-helix transcriptional regulator [Streptomyces sp. NBC_00052]MCX5549169.1 helix-turn-helix transcriptional regulator [Streptomyces sp. NBC_0
MSEGADQAREPANGAVYFGEETKALREALVLSQEQFADKLHYRQAQVSKVENGAVLASGPFAEAMDRVAGTPGVYARLRAKLSKQGHPEWFVPYITLEESASGITDYSCTFLMGLLQTPEYARAVIRAAFPRETAEQIERRVELRIRRQVVIERDEPPLLWVVIHEAVLRACVGGRAVMIGQLEHLIAQMTSPHVTVQVLPYKAGAAPSHLPFTLLSLNDTPHAVYAETPTHGGQVDDTSSVVATAVSMFDRLRMAALSEEESLTLIRKIMEDHAT